MESMLQTRPSRVFTEEAEMSAIMELRRRFPGVAPGANARACVRTIAGWTPPPERRTAWLPCGRAGQRRRDGGPAKFGFPGRRRSPACGREGGITKRQSQRPRSTPPDRPRHAARRPDVAGCAAKRRQAAS
jgi:hypothetical protein